MPILRQTSTTSVPFSACRSAYAIFTGVFRVFIKT